MRSEVVAVDGLDAALRVERRLRATPLQVAGATCGCCVRQRTAAAGTSSEWPLAPAQPPSATDRRRGQACRLEQAGVDVVQEAADLHGVGDQRVRADLAHVVGERGVLVRDHAEGLPRRVLAGRARRPLAAARRRWRSAIAQRVCGTTRIRLTLSRWTPSTSASRAWAVTRPPGLRKILASPGCEPEHPQRVDAGVHAGHDGHPGVGHAVEPAELEGLGERPGWRRAGRRTRRSRPQPYRTGARPSTDHAQGSACVPSLRTRHVPHDVRRRRERDSTCPSPAVGVRRAVTVQPGVQPSDVPRPWPR